MEWLYISFGEQNHREKLDPKSGKTTEFSRAAV